MQESHICDHCKDPKSPVTPRNGGTVTAGDARLKNAVLAYVHDKCRMHGRESMAAEPTTL